jgi:hypothetical protein
MSSVGVRENGQASRETGESDCHKSERNFMSEVCPTCGSPDRDKPYTSHFAGVPIAECADEFHRKVCPTCGSDDKKVRNHVKEDRGLHMSRHTRKCPDPWHKVDSLLVATPYVYIWRCTITPTLRLYSRQPAGESWQTSLPSGYTRTAPSRISSKRRDDSFGSGCQR